MADSVPGNMSSTAGVAVGGTVTGTIETPGDHDWYRVSLIAGQSYSFVTSATDTTDIDTFLTLRDAAGATLVSDDDGGHDAGFESAARLLDDRGPLIAVDDVERDGERLGV